MRKTWYAVSRSCREKFAPVAILKPNRGIKNSLTSESSYHLLHIMPAYRSIIVEVINSKGIGGLQVPWSTLTEHRE